MSDPDGRDGHGATKAGAEPERPAAEKPESTQQAARPPVFQQRQVLTVLVFAVVAAVVLPLWIGDNQYNASVINLMLITAIAAVGFYFAFALGGQFAFSQAAFMAIGAYSSAWFATNVGGFVVGLLAAIVVSAILASAFGLLVMGARHFYFAIATLGFAEITVIVIRGWNEVGGIHGELSNIGRPALGPIALNAQTHIFWLALGLLTVGLLVGAMIERSPLRRESIAVRDLPEIAGTLGVPVGKIAVLMFVIGSIYAGVAGSLFAHRSGFITTASFEIGLAIDIFLMVILGGMRSMWGAVIGAAFVVLLPEYLRPVAEYRPLIFALLLLVTIIALPNGLLGVFDRLKQIGRRNA